MNEQRNQFLTEAMEECWHNKVGPSDGYEYTHCIKCQADYWHLKFNDFSSWADFGKLVEFIAPEHIESFALKMIENAMPFDAGFPDRFATNYFNYLKGDA